MDPLKTSGVFCCNTNETQEDKIKRELDAWANLIIDFYLAENYDEKVEKEQNG